MLIADCLPHGMQVARLPGYRTRKLVHARDGGGMLFILFDSASDAQGALAHMRTMDPASHACAHHGALSPQVRSRTCVRWSGSRVTAARGRSR